jgi:hypothetical protein
MHNIAYRQHRESGTQYELPCLLCWCRVHQRNVTVIIFVFLVFLGDLMLLPLIKRKVLELDRGPLMVAQWLRYCATNRKVAGSIPDGVIGIFY